jgi:CDP-6-deoxy-D-xylo-4-hexulose-3-dehydrase
VNNEIVQRIAGVIELLLESSSRINEAKPQRYWYPLSMASYGAEEVLEALDSMVSFRTSMWEKTRRFEEAFAREQGAKDAVMVNSGSSADLLLSFLLCDPAKRMLAPGDVVLVPAVTWPTQIWSVLMAGLRVRLVDVDPETLNISLADLERKLTPDVKAIFLVHLMGNPCEMDRILELARERKILVLEDCCEALGAEWRGTKVGNFGLGGAFSFFFSHHITTMEGGMITVNDPALADRLRILRAHGWLRNVDQSQFPLQDESIDPRYAFVDWGFNVRPTELQAGFGLQQLQKLPRFTERRDALASRFFAYIDSTRFLTRPRVSPHARPVWMALPLMVRPDAPFTRGQLTAHLEAAGVETRPVVTGNVARQPAAALFPDLRATPNPGADEIHERGFYVGLSPFVTDAAMDRLIEVLGAFFARH